MIPPVLTLITVLLACLLHGCTPADPIEDSTPATPAPAPAPAPAAMPDLSEATSETEAPPAIDLATLALLIDPVCKMSLEEYAPVASAEHDGKTYGFCADFCKRKFVEDPEKLLARLEPQASTADEKP